ncbi:MAG: sulfatase-like hydrolase/transferase, partial [Bdellovibrionales bacterium]
VDGLIGQVLDAVESKNQLQNTVIIFTSDHGQEFNDNKNNFWGHNSNFTDAQTRVPFFIYWPERKPQIINHWTSHYDVPSTVLEELFNCTTSSQDYSSGHNLFKHPGADWLLHGTYGDFAIRLKDHLVVISLSGNYQILDHQYFEKKEANSDPQIYQKALHEMRRFYK